MLCRVVLLLKPLQMICEVEARGDVKWWWGVVHYIFLDFLEFMRSSALGYRKGWVGGIPGFFFSFFLFPDSAEMMR
jgi:hypothetical protein